jgi:hypothetical protein
MLPKMPLRRSRDESIPSRMARAFREVRNQRQVELHAAEHLVHRQDIRRLDVDPGEHALVLEFGVEPSDGEGSH